MKYATRIGSALVVLLLLSGCVTTNASMLGATTNARPALLPNQVALYRIASQVPGQYEEVALLNSAGDSGFTDEAKMFASMKKKAGELGANGVILDAVSEPSAGAKVAAAIFGVSAQRKGKAIAIYIIPGSVAPTPATPSAQSAQPPAQNSSNCVACEKIGKDL
nr:putative integron gene cassette protein [uncultured bacterium]